MRYRKKPIVVEAKKFDGSNALAISEWATEFNARIHWKNLVGSHGERILRIETLEGIMTAYPGDWIIKGINDEFYPCQSDIFEKTYEPVED